MSQKVYKFYLAKMKDAYFQLSPEQRAGLEGQLNNALVKVGGKRVLNCDPSWGNEQWHLVGVEEFPSLEAVQEHTQLLAALGWMLYCDGKSILATEYPG